MKPFLPTKPHLPAQGYTSQRDRQLKTLAVRVQVQTVEFRKELHELFGFTELKTDTTQEAGVHSVSMIFLGLSIETGQEFLSSFCAGANTMINGHMRQANLSTPTF